MVLDWNIAALKEMYLDSGFLNTLAMKMDHFL